MSKHISRNRETTINASRKTAHDKVFLFWDKKAIFSTTKMVASSNIALNLYIGINVLVYARWLVLKVWYTAGRPAQRFHHYILTLLMHVSQKWPITEMSYPKCLHS